MIHLSTSLPSPMDMIFCSRRWVLDVCRGDGCFRFQGQTAAARHFTLQFSLRGMQRGFCRQGDPVNLAKASQPSKLCVCTKSLQLCPTLSNPMDCSLPGSSIHGISQARVLEWVALSFSRGSSRPRDQTRIYLHCRQILYHLSHQGNSKG